MDEVGDLNTDRKMYVLLLCRLRARVGVPWVQLGYPVVYCWSFWGGIVVGHFVNCYVEFHFLKFFFSRLILCKMIMYSFKFG